MRERVIASVINLSLAEISALQAFQVYSSSPYSTFYPPDVFFIPVLLLPLIFMIRKSNPFSFMHYSLLILLCTGVLLAGSEIFYAILNAIYTVGYRDLSEYINSVFESYRGASTFHPLLLITWAFLLSQFLWNSVGKIEGREIFVQWGYIFSVSTILFAAYPYFTGMAVLYSYPLLLMGIGGLIFLLAAAYLLSR